MISSRIMSLLKIPKHKLINLGAIRGLYFESAQIVGSSIVDVPLFMSEYCEHGIAGVLVR